MMRKIKEVRNDIRKMEAGRNNDSTLCLELYYIHYCPDTTVQRNT